MELKQALELFKQTRIQPKNYNTIWANHPLEQIVIDLMDMSKVSTKKGNKNMNFALVCVDIHSRFAWVIPIKNKSTKSVLEALSTVPKPKVFVSDNGSEWKGMVAEYMKEHNIQHYTNEIGDHRTMGVVDRFIRTLRQRMRILWELNNDFDWVSHIDQIVKDYNIATHSTIKAKPVLVLAGKDTNKQKVNRPDVFSDFQPGTKVRKLLKRNPFEKGGKAWSKQIFNVTGRSGFKLVLNDGTRHSPFDLLKTTFSNSDEPTLQEKTQQVTSEKTQAQKLKREVGVERDQIPELLAAPALATQKKSTRTRKAIDRLDL